MCINKPIGLMEIKLLSLLTGIAMFNSFCDFQVATAADSTTNVCLKRMYECIKILLQVVFVFVHCFLNKKLFM